MRFFIHYFLHFGFPLIIALVFFRKDWKKVYLIFIATMLVDLDHLLADPIFQINRCSINFHLLHTYYAIVVYIILLFFKKTFTLIGLGLLLHMATDLTDCVMLYTECRSCLENTPSWGLVKEISKLFDL